MGIFNFLKKKEIAQIKQLSEQIKVLKQENLNLSKYQGIIDTNIIIAQKLADLETSKQTYFIELEETKEIISSLKTEYDIAHSVYLNLKHQIDIFTESLELSEYGIYDPHFDFDTSEKFKTEISTVRGEQKRYTEQDQAISGGDNISWNGSLSQGQAMVKREKKLMMRAFNGECDSFIATVDWNNVQRMTERIHKSFDAINKTYEKQGIAITNLYKDSKIKELQLTYEYKNKKYEEKEEQRAIREQMREEEKVRREIEVTRIKAEKEEEAYQKALDKARYEVERASGKNQNKLKQQIAELEAKLLETEQNKKRALSMAQQTRRGHVYVISNIGSFGDNIYKIGMTRRLDPIDRVNELGDASVPFVFDIHALIFSEDAPALENVLHKTFEEKRVNLVNYKREFFNVSLDEIEKEVFKNHGEIEFTKVAEAAQYRETLSARARNQNITTPDFPEKIFN